MWGAEARHFLVGFPCVLRAVGGVGHGWWWGVNVWVLGVGFQGVEAASVSEEEEEED